MARRGDPSKRPATSAHRKEAAVFIVAFYGHMHSGQIDFGVDLPAVAWRFQAVRLRRGYGARSGLRFALRSKRRLERVTRLELATSSLARRCSTTELHPRFEREEIMSSGRRDATFLIAPQSGIFE